MLRVNLIFVVAVILLPSRMVWQTLILMAPNQINVVNFIVNGESLASTSTPSPNIFSLSNCDSYSSVWYYVKFAA
jgi:hypothetical protein